MFDEKDLNLVFVCLCRSIGWETRLIAVLNPIPLSLSKTKQEQSFYFCSEIYDTQKRQWLIVDCMNDFIGNKYREELLSFKISYVLGFEQDGTVKDLTQRYTSYWNTVSRKRRLPDKPGGLEWWNVCLWLYSKSQRTVKDDLDDVSLLESVKQEKMPTRLDDFINHPIYALERHLKKNQIIDPKTVIGVYKSQNVYSRANVQDLFTMQQWRRMGKTVVGQPMKQVVIKNQPEDLYAASQTQEMERPPLMNGKIPKSLYGNVELFHPNMLPLECVHVQEPHAHTVAKTLGLDFGRAVVDFSYGKRVHPIYDGIVLKAVDRQLLMEALESYLGSLQEQEQSKREKRVLDRWRLLTARLLLKERLEREYA
ncbi:hypothetical protein EDD86DRAFT_187612 [Gorgonomyces haynaldii]|nr:hypothetical protein EDD86DRAFT_187612 [Gorgonomyces haynaldii]